MTIFLTRGSFFKILPFAYMEGYSMFFFF